MIAYTLKVAIVAATIALLYAYWDAIERAYHRASSYVKEVNARLGVQASLEGVEQSPGKGDMQATRVIIPPVHPLPPPVI
ncbi:MAG: hypothetical protein D6819_09625, partial [Gammaproteobacteria bacterium]